MSKTTARSIADVSKRSVLARVDIAAPPERVWTAITEDVATWWSSAELSKTTTHTVDLRAGGSFRSDGVGADGKPFHVTGDVLEVDPPRRYVTTWQPSWTTEPASRVTYLLEPTAIGTRVTVEHTGLASPESCETQGDGWTRVLDCLAGHAQPRPTYYLVRLIPPRPTFMHDLTADERVVMAAHAAYWRGKLAAGSVIAFGPSMEGVGLGFVAAADADALRAFQDGDPVIQSGRGFRYEQVPMVTLVH
jgi:uncharacterized protein YndB with AHSA1/START domain|nr:SRPBCC domain-containing protein [Kofleriaceae bacterium]